MSDAKKTPPPAPAPPAPASSTPKWLPLVVGVNTLLLFAVVGFMAWTMLHKPAPADAPGEEPEAKAEEHAAAEPKKEAPKKEKAEGKEGGKEAEHPSSGAVNGPGPMVRMPDFVVHLRNSDLDRYARITFEIEVIADLDKDRVTANMPRVRDAFIAYLSDRTVEELAGSEGLARTKDALYQRVRELVPDARFRALYISDFVVQ